MKYKNNNNRKYKLVSVIKPNVCPKCKSKELIKWGFRFNHTTKKQRWKCKSCSECFVVDDGFFKKKHKREVITNCISLYMNGMSLRKSVQHFNQFAEYEVSHQSVLNWIRDYAHLLKDFQQKFALKLSRQYHADELFVKCKNEQHYFWDMIDKGTRVLVSTHYSKKRDTKSAKMLFFKAQHKPLNLFTDSAFAYIKAYRKVWGARNKKIDKEVYTRLKQGEDRRNNIVERIQGTIRERTKVMRSFKSPKSAEAILSLFVVYYNFIRIHQGIGRTPIEEAGVNLNLGKNKWLDLIYLASQKP